ncbi:MAG: S-layer homology domain-containing protein [Oscillospiraceae bacterium]
MKKLTCFLLVLCLLCSFASVFGVEPAEPVLDVETTEIVPVEHEKAVCAVASSSAALAEGDSDTAEEVQFEGGDGSPEDPYQIATLEQLETFRDLVNAGNESICAKLVDDIVINEDPAASIRDGKEDELVTFTPIGTGNVWYNGIFEGNNHTITGLYLSKIINDSDSSTSEYSEYSYALFGKTSSKAHISHLALDKVYLFCDSQNNANIILGGLVAYNGSEADGFSDCSVSGDIFVTAASGNIMAGGLGGRGFNQSATYSHSENHCNISVKVGTGAAAVGGISGYSGATKQCVNYGSIRVSLMSQTVSEQLGTMYIGGIIGYTSSTPSYSYNLGEIVVNTGKDDCIAVVGGIVGYLDGSTKYAYNLGNISATSGNAFVGGCVGRGSVDYAYNKGSVSATCTADEAYALAGGITAEASKNTSISNLYNYGNVIANGKNDSAIGAAGIAAICGNSVTNCYNLGAVTASGNSDAVADTITFATNSEDQITLEELYSLKWIAPVSDFCTELTQAEFKTLWTDETHPEWDYAPVFDNVLYQETPFSDTNPLSWYYDATVYAYTNDLMQGMSMTKFEPNLAMTRAMLVTVLYRMAGSPDVSAMENPFPDIPADTWYTDAVIWAANNNIVKGYQEDGNFHPTWDITREQIASILYRYVTEYLGETAGVFGDLSTFPDSNSVSEYARESIAWATGEGLITGTREGDQVLLDPRGLATRAQIATILMRFCQNDAE